MKPDTTCAITGKTLPAGPVDATAFRERARQRVEHTRAAQKQMRSGAQPGEVREPGRQ